MDPNGNIYRAPEDEIPAEDKARLDGFLRGREEAAVLDEAEKLRMREQIASLKEEAMGRER